MAHLFSGSTLFVPGHTAGYFSMNDAPDQVDIYEKHKSVFEHIAETFRFSSD